MCVLYNDETLIISLPECSGAVHPTLFITKELRGRRSMCELIGFHQGLEGLVKYQD